MDTLSLIPYLGQGKIFDEIFWRLKASVDNKIIPDFTAFIIGKQFSQMKQEKKFFENRNFWQETNFSKNVDFEFSSSPRVFQQLW